MSATWFRCDPAKLIGALSGMAPENGYVYTMILMRIYEVGGPIDDDEHVLARRTGYAVKRVAEAIQWLLQRDKIQRLENGLLDSRTTHEELAYREKLIKDAQNAGNSSGKKRIKVSFKKRKQNQQNSPTTVERPLNARQTPVERPSTEIEGDIELANASSKRTPKSILLGCLSEETADGVIEHRKAKKAPLTIIAAEELVKGFNSTGDPEDAARTMVARGWQGFEKSWYDKGKSDGRSGKLSVQEAARNLAASVVDFGPVPPPYLPTGRGLSQSSGAPRLLSEGGCGRSGDVFGGSGIGAVILPPAGGLPSDGPQERIGGKEPMAADRGRG